MPADCALLLAHGAYSPSASIITVPKNIKLVQFAAPRAPLLWGEVVHLLKYKSRSTCSPPSEIPKHMYFVHSKTGEMYESIYKTKVIAPGQTTTNNIFSFQAKSVWESDKFQTTPRLEHPDGTTQYKDEDVTHTLKDLLAQLSEKYAADYPDQIITLWQMSCRIEVPNKKKEYIYRDPDELARDLEQLRLKSPGKFKPIELGLPTEIYGHMYLSKDDAEAAARRALLKLSRSHVGKRTAAITAAKKTRTKRRSRSRSRSRSRNRSNSRMEVVE